VLNDCAALAMRLIDPRPCERRLHFGSLVSSAETQDQRGPEPCAVARA
jgi:hypothetical protein